MENEEDYKLFRPCDVFKLTTLSRTTIWRLRKLSDFPAPVQLSRGRVAFRRREILAWLRDRT